MSERRKIGDRVWLKPGAGFGFSKGEWATIIDWPSNHPDQLWSCCFYPDYCDDPNCQEWNDLKADRDGISVHHVSECQMLDELQKAAG